MQNAQLIRSGAVSAAGRTDGFAALYRKELADHLRSVRFRVVFALLLITSMISLFSALGSMQDRSGDTYLLLSVFTASGGSLPSTASFLAYLTPILGIVLGFDAISRERSQGTLNRLVSQPIYRDHVIVAKYLAGIAVIALMLATVGVLSGAVELIVLGVPPKGEELMRLLSYLLLTIVYASLWLGCSLLCSVLTRHAATSALIMIAAWIYLTIFSGMVAGAIAGALYPTDGIEGYANLMSYYRTDLALQRCSPYYLYCEAVSTLLDPNVRALGITTQAAYSGAVAGYLSFDQSLLLIWPHIVCMIALMLAAFAVAYVSFMRQEIRA